MRLISRTAFWLLIAASAVQTASAAASTTPPASISAPPAPLLSVGLPQPFALGLDYALNPKLHFMVSGGYSPVPVVLGGKLSVGSLEAWAKWHPFAGPFFLGGALGYQSIQYRTVLNLGTLSPENGPQPSVLSLNSLYLAVGVGFLWTIKERLLLGFDLGVQIPVFSRGSLQINGVSESNQNLESAAADPLGYYAGFVLPRIHFLRIGWIL